MSPNQLLKVVLPFLVLLALSGWAVAQSRTPAHVAQAQSVSPTPHTVDAAAADAVYQPGAIDIDSLGIWTNSPQPLGHAIIFTATFTGDPTGYTFSWSFGDGDTAEGTVVGHVYEKPGVYEVLLIASDGIFSLEQVTRVEVLDAPVGPDIPITGLRVTTNNAVEEGDPSNFIASVQTGTNVRYTWDFGDGTTKEGAAASHIYEDLGWYMVTVTAQNNVSVERATIAADVVEAFVKGLRMASSAPTFLGQATTFTATTLAGSNVLFSWNFGDGAVVEVPPIPGNERISVIQHMYMMPGNYNVSVRAFNTRNSLFNTMDNIRVVGEPPPSVCPTIVSTSPQRPGQPVGFFAEPNGGVNLRYFWRFGDGATGRGQVVEHVYEDAGVYAVTLYVSNSQGTVVCPAVVEITESALPEIEIRSENNVALPSESITFEIVRPLRVDWLYTWDFGDDTIISGTITEVGTVSHTYGLPAANVVTVTAEDSARNTEEARGHIAAITNAFPFYMARICMPHSAFCRFSLSSGGEDARPTSTPVPPTSTPEATPTTPSPPASPTNTPETPSTLPPPPPTETATATAVPTAAPTATPTVGGTIPPGESIPPPAD